jgi:transcriptional regulator of met regulon
VDNNLNNDRINNDNINRPNINNIDHYPNNNLRNNNYLDPSKDKNTDTDKDLIKDRNTKQEDIRR